MKLLYPLFISLFLFANVSLLHSQELSPVWPKQGATVFEANIEFLWNTAPEASSYNIQIFSGGEIVEEANVAGNTFNWNIPVFADYQWRLQSVYLDSIADWGDFYDFTYFSPSVVDELVLWLEPTNVVLQDGRVSQWSDSSGLGHHVTQGAVASQPQWVENSLNGLPTLRFDGGNDYLDGGDILDLEDNSRGIFIIGQAETTGRYIAKARASGAIDRFAVSKTNNELVFLYHDNDIRNINIPFNSNNEVNLITVITHRNEGENSLFINSIFSASNTINKVHNWQSDYNFLIGAYNNSSGYIPPVSYHQGDIAEILIYDRELLA